MSSADHSAVSTPVQPDTVQPTYSNNSGASTPVLNEPLDKLKESQVSPGDWEEKDASLPVRPFSDYITVCLVSMCRVRWFHVWMGYRYHFWFHQPN